MMEKKGPLFKQGQRVISRIDMGEIAEGCLGTIKHINNPDWNGIYWYMVTWDNEPDGWRISPEGELDSAPGRGS
jgi:hypothetical protein